MKTINKKNIPLFSVFSLFILLLFYLLLSVIEVNAGVIPKFKNSEYKERFHGRELYRKYGCAVCHGKLRFGNSAQPLLPEFIGRYSISKLKSIISNGLSPVPMPSFKNLSKKDLSDLVSYLEEPSKTVLWTRADIIKSRIKFPGIKNPDIKPVNVKNLMAAVIGGSGKIWVLKGTKILNKFNFGDIHGGLKYSPSGRYLYLPSTTGYIGKYDFYTMKLSYKVRACRYLRNISLSKGGRDVIAACWLPESIVVLNAKNLKLVKKISLKHRVSVIYGLFRNNMAVFSFMHKPVMGILDTGAWNISYYKIPVPFQDFFVDPLDEYAVGGSFKGGNIFAFSLKKKEIVYSGSSYGIPHPAGAAFWFYRGKFYFALSNLIKPFISVWRMYDWKFIKNIYTGGPGFFVKTNPYSSYLWADNSSDAVVLINKNNFRTKKIVIKKRGLIIHTQFSGNERLAYISDYGRHGELAVMNAATLKIIKTIPANGIIGKYNYVNYQRMNDAALLGEEVYFTYCWGCHNPTLQAIGPSFSYIARHINKAEIEEQTAHPGRTSRLLGYKANAMPVFDLTKQEINALIAFIKDSGNRNFWRNGN